MATEVNPFSFRHVTSLTYFFPPETTPALLAERFEHCGQAAQIIGPHGTGKSTLLETLVQRLKPPVYKTVLRDHQRRLSADFFEYCSKNCVVVIDGYEQLSALSRWRLWLKRRRLGFKLLITAHRPVFGWPILYETAPDRETYNRILQTLLENETKNETRIDSQMFDLLYTKHHGNMRRILLDLYDLWEERTVSRQ